MEEKQIFHALLKKIRDILLSFALSTNAAYATTDDFSSLGKGAHGTTLSKHNPRVEKASAALADLIRHAIPKADVLIADGDHSKLEMRAAALSDVVFDALAERNIAQVSWEMPIELQRKVDQLQDGKIRDCPEPC